MYRYGQKRAETEKSTLRLGQHVWLHDLFGGWTHGQVVCINGEWGNDNAKRVWESSPLGARLITPVMAVEVGGSNAGRLSPVDAGKYITGERYAYLTDLVESWRVAKKGANVGFVKFFADKGLTPIECAWVMYETGETGL
jgi:hypothetical protein